MKLQSSWQPVSVFQYCVQSRLKESRPSQGLDFQEDIQGHKATNQTKLMRCIMPFTDT